MSNTAVAWIGPITGPFAWVFENCSTQVKTGLEINTGPKVTIGLWRSATEWFEESEETRASFSRLIFALPRRDRILVQQINALNQNEPFISVCCILSDLWLGHYRSVIPGLSVPSFYWWNLQDQILPWLHQASPQNSLELFHAKLAEGNDYWKRPLANNSNVLTSLRSIVLSSCERSVQPLVHALLGLQQRVDSIYFDSSDPLKQLEQFAKCPKLSAQLRPFLLDCQSSSSDATICSSHATVCSSHATIWWCGGIFNPAQRDCLSRELAFLLREKIATWKGAGNVEFGWYATLADAPQWEVLRSLGFSKLLAPPFRIPSIV